MSVMLTIGLVCIAIFAVLFVYVVEALDQMQKEIDELKAKLEDDGR